VTPIALIALAAAHGPVSRPPLEVVIRAFLSELGLAPVPLSGYFPPHASPIPIIFAWQLVTAIPIVAALLRGR
jgi:hypothetical protein